MVSCDVQRKFLLIVNDLLFWIQSLDLKALLNFAYCEIKNNTTIFIYYQRVKLYKSIFFNYKKRLLVNFTSDKTGFQDNDILSPITTGA